MSNTLNAEQIDVLEKTKQFILDENRLSESNIGFSMVFWNEDYINVEDCYDYDEFIDCKGKHCGTLMCIGGTIEYINKIESASEFLEGDVENKDREESIDRLFYPHERYDYKKITAKQACSAIDCFIKEPNSFSWDKIEGIELDEDFYDDWIT